MRYSSSELWRGSQLHCNWLKANIQNIAITACTDQRPAGADSYQSHQARLRFHVQWTSQVRGLDILDWPVDTWSSGWNGRYRRLGLKRETSSLLYVVPVSSFIIINLINKIIINGWETFVLRTAETNLRGITMMYPADEVERLYPRTTQSVSRRSHWSSTQHCWLLARFIGTLHVCRLRWHCIPVLEATTRT